MKTNFFKIILLIQILPKDNKKSSNQVFQSREHSPIKKVIKPNSIINIINNEKTNNGLLKKTSTETISFYSKYLSCGIIDFNLLEIYFYFKIILF
jgi:hypothetical protein